MNGIYIHVPFCLKKCGYCDFYSVTDTGLIEAWITSLCREIALTARTETPENLTVDTVYFGGGTPSVLPQHGLETILGAVRTHYRPVPGTEITLEVNPGTVPPGALRSYAAMGINRLSVGVQSFQDSHLTFLGRIHRALEAETLIESARNEGFTNLGIDLIYGMPGQCAGNWLRDLHKAVSFAPAHLSCYLLSFEEGTPLHASLSGGFFTALDEGLCARLFTRTMDTLKGLGYHHYEISNFARSPETISRHNSKYWDFEPYRGFGPSAHSYVPSERKRYWNVRDVNAYIAALNQDRLPVEDMEILTPAQQMTEALFLSLRKRAGIDVTAFNARFGTDFRTMFAPVLDSQIQNGMVAMTNDRVYLTVKGILFADRIAEMFAGRVEDEQQTIKP